ncbi:MAG: 5'/3'-nucleotidase SurE [Methanosphaera sp.]|nr:5'/3'-nucleotidase SurE [Methanosphaera sp.]
MKILVTNDDGINSNGIIAAKDAAQQHADTTVVAPLTQQSGVGHKITLMKPLRATPTQLMDKSEGYIVDGTPTDCVILGVNSIMDEKPDLVVSGINIGENLSKSITTSGTLGATFEAASFKIPAIAVSLQVIREDVKFSNGVHNIDYNYAKKILSKLIGRVIEYGMPTGVDILNLNIPAKPSGEDIIQAPFAHRMYTTDVEKRIDPYGHPYYWIIGNMVDDENENTDVNTIRKRCLPTVTPVSIDMSVNTDISKWLEE